MSKLLGISKSIQLLFQDYPFLATEYPTLVSKLSQTASAPDDDDNPNPIHDLIDASSLNSKIKDALKGLSTEPTEERAKEVISYLETYYAREDLFMRGSEKGDETTIPLDDIHRDGIALWTINNRKWGMLKNDLGNTYDAYVAQAVHIIEKNTDPKTDPVTPIEGTGTKLKITHDFIQKWIESKCTEDKSIFSKSGKLIYVKNTYPIFLKGSVDPFSVAVGLSKPYLSHKPFDNNVVLQEIRQTSTWVPGKSLKSSITAAGGSYSGEIFPGIEPAIKLDLLKLTQEAAAKASNSNTAIAKIELAAIVVQLNFTDKSFKAIAEWLGFPNMFDGTIEKASFGIKFSINFDTFRYVASEVTDKAEKAALRRLEQLSKEGLKQTDQLISGIEKKQSRKLLKPTAKKLKETIEGKMKRVMYKELRSKAAKKVGTRIIKQTGTAMLSKFGKSLATRMVLKAIPVVNVISTIVDVFWIGCAIYNYYSSPPAPSPEQVARMEQKRAWENISDRIRDEANEVMVDNRRYVVLRAFNYLAKEGSGMYYYSAHMRSEIHLKFYESSAIGGDFYKKGADKGKAKYADYYISHGSERAGEGVKIAHKIYEERESSESKVLEFLKKGENPRYAPRYKAMPLLGDDDAELMVMSDYWALKERMEILDQYYKEP